MELEVSPGGAISIRRGGQMELPSSRELGNKVRELGNKISEMGKSLFPERRRAKEKVVSLRELMSSVSLQAGNPESIPDQTKLKTAEMGQLLADLSLEKPVFVRSVFAEILPHRLRKRRELAKTLADYLQNPQQDEDERLKRSGVMFDGFGFNKNQKELVLRLANLFQQVGQQPGQQPGIQPQPGGVAGPEAAGPRRQGPRRDEELRRARGTVRAETRGVRTAALSSIRKSVTWPLIGGVLLVSIWTVAERDGSIKLSPAWPMLEKVGLADTAVESQYKESVAPRIQGVIEGPFVVSPEYQPFTIKEWFNEVLADPKNRENPIKPWQWDAIAKNYIKGLEKVLGKNNIPVDQMTERLESRYPPQLRDRLEVGERVLLSYKSRQPLTTEDIQAMKRIWEEQREAPWSH